MSESEGGKRKLEEAVDQPDEVVNKRQAVAVSVRKPRLLLTEIAVDGLEIKSFDRSQYTKQQKRFKYKLTLPEPIDNAYANPSRLFLDAWVMDNNLSILMVPSPLVDVVSVETVQERFKFKAVKSKPTKTKVKKGVKLVDARDVLAEVTCQSPGEEPKFYHLISPIQGKQLEINSRLLTSPQLLSSHPHADGFVAVLSSVVPDIIGRCGPSILTLESEASISQLCFQWIRGSCPKGGDCKYFHPSGASTSFDVNNDVAI